TGKPDKTSLSESRGIARNNTAFHIRACSCRQLDHRAEKTYKSIIVEVHVDATGRRRTIPDDPYLICATGSIRLKKTTHQWFYAVQLVCDSPALKAV
ncbi:hypothetical protein MAR_005833, partial [Mya arenaria]